MYEIVILFSGNKIGFIFSEEAFSFSRITFCCTL